jgi:hypothetical protein
MHSVRAGSETTKLNHEGIRNMKKTIVTIACCALVAPLAFAKDSKHKKHMGYVEQNGVTVTAKAPITRIDGGEVAGFQPPNTVVIHSDGPGYYTLGPGYVFSSKGQPVDAPLRAGTRVHVYFASEGGLKTIDHVVVD